MAPIRSLGTPARPRTNAVRSDILIRPVLIIGALCFTAWGFQAPAPKAAATPTTPARELVNKYCVSCHNQKLKTANLMLDNADAVHVSNSAETWEEVVVKLR